MTVVFFKAILFFILSLIYFYSVSGCGKILLNTFNYKNITNNFFELFIYGIIFKLIFGFFIYISIGNNEYFNLFILVFGLYFYFFYKKKLNIFSFKYLSFFLLTTFTVLLISKTHEDFGFYHYFSIDEIFNNKLRIGTYLINQNFFYSSLLVHVQSLIVLPFLEYKLIHFPIFFIYFSVIGYFIFLIFNSINKTERFFSLMIVMILLIKFNRLTEFGFDYISQFLLLVVFHKIYFYKNNKIELMMALHIFTFCILIKPNSLLFSPILLYMLYSNKLRFIISLITYKNFIFYLMIFILLTSSFFRSGCVFYPINKTCFEKEKIFWSEKKNIKEFSEFVSLWAKAYHAHIKKGSKYDLITDQKEYNKKFNWFKFWVEHHFFYKVFEFLLIISSIILIIHFYLIREKPNIKKFSIENNILFILSSSSIFLWLITIPQFRFGFSAIIIFFFSFFNYFLKLEVDINKKKILTLILLSLFILNLKNIHRIKDRFERDDLWKFTNFPFYNTENVDKRKLKEKYLLKEKFFHIEILKPNPN